LKKNNYYNILYYYTTMPQIPNYGYDETTEGELNKAKRRVIGYMDATHERVTEYPETDPTNGKVSMDLSTLTDLVYMTIKTIDTLDSYIRLDQTLLDANVSITSEVKQTVKDLITVNNNLRKINRDYDRLSPNIKYVELSVYTDFTSSISTLKKASHTFYGFLDRFIAAVRRGRGEEYDRPDVVDDDDDEPPDDGAPPPDDGAPPPDDGGFPPLPPPPDDGDDGDDGDGGPPPPPAEAVGRPILPAYMGPFGAPPPSPPMPPPTSKPVPPLSIPPLASSSSGDAPFASPSMDKPPSSRPPSSRPPLSGVFSGLLTARASYEKVDKKRSFADAYDEYRNDKMDEAYAKFIDASTSELAQELIMERYEAYYKKNFKLPNAKQRLKLVDTAIEDAATPLISPSTTPAAPPAAAPPTGLSPITGSPSISPTPTKPGKRPVLSGPPLADLPPRKPSPLVPSPPAKKPTGFSDEELFWPDLVAETIPNTDIDRIMSLPNWPDLTTSQQTKFAARFKLDKDAVNVGLTPPALKANSAYFTIWKKLLGAESPRQFQQYLSTSKTPRKPVKV